MNKNSMRKAGLESASIDYLQWVSSITSSSLKQGAAMEMRLLSTSIVDPICDRPCLFSPMAEGD